MCVSRGNDVLFPDPPPDVVADDMDMEMEKHRLSYFHYRLTLHQSTLNALLDASTLHSFNTNAYLATYLIKTTRLKYFVQKYT